MAKTAKKGKPKTKAASKAPKKSVKTTAKAPKKSGSMKTELPSSISAMIKETADRTVAASLDFSYDKIATQERKLFGKEILSEMKAISEEMKKTSAEFNKGVSGRIASETKEVASEMGKLAVEIRKAVTAVVSLVKETKGAPAVKPTAAKKATTAISKAEVVKESSRGKTQADHFNDFVANGKSFKFVDVAKYFKKSKIGVTEGSLRQLIYAASRSGLIKLKSHGTYIATEKDSSAPEKATSKKATSKKSASKKGKKTTSQSKVSSKPDAKKKLHEAKVKHIMALVKKGKLISADDFYAWFENSKTPKIAVGAKPLEIIQAVGTLIKLGKVRKHAQGVYSIPKRFKKAEIAAFSEKAAKKRKIIKSGSVAQAKKFDKKDTELVKKVIKTKNAKSKKQGNFTEDIREFFRTHKKKGGYTMVEMLEAINTAQKKARSKVVDSKILGITLAGMVKRGDSVEKVERGVYRKIA